MCMCVIYVKSYGINDDVYIRCKRKILTTLTYSYVETMQIRYGINDYVNQTQEDNTNINLHHDTHINDMC